MLNEYISVLPPLKLFINGEWVSPTDNRTTSIINPANEEVFTTAPLGKVADAQFAINAARIAFDNKSWSGLAAEQRQKVLQKFLQALRARKDRIVALNIAEAGSIRSLAEFLQFEIPMAHAHWQVEHCIRPNVEPAALAIVPQMDGTSALSSGVVHRAPVGVVAAITAYNFPFFLNMMKVIPALAVGCTVVLKPAPQTPLEALILGEAAVESGLPPGVLNIVTGGTEVGETLTTDPRVDLVSFTGSDTVGSAIMAQSAPSLKRVLLELGGKSALIVREDADLMAAAQAGLAGFTIHSGQGCGLQTRHIVHNSVRAAYVDLLKQFNSGLRIGNPADPSVTIGPLISATARAKAEFYTEIALQEGTNLIFGGKRPGNLPKGFYFEPTLFDNVDNRSRLAQEEVFGPVGAVIGYDTDEEAIALANDSQFGLGGGIYSRNTGIAFEMAKALQTGYVYINGGSGSMMSHLPFGGIKRSGFGRELGIEGLNEFTYTKSIDFRAG